jgi:hypothetical protein
MEKRRPMKQHLGNFLLKACLSYLIVFCLMTTFAKPSEGYYGSSMYGSSMYGGLYGSSMYGGLYGSSMYGGLYGSVI